ncbi:hypothetical protein F2B00_36275 [Streptomyces parvus]|nr:hypothetical protein F2B00_36275 [Streptomyces parvus]
MTEDRLRHNVGRRRRLPTGRRGPGHHHRHHSDDAGRSRGCAGHRPDGLHRRRCNRGDQVYASADEGKRVVWLDGTTGCTNVVKRDRPAGAC